MAKKPKLGQNFLVDENACVRIADALGDATERTVVEIGPAMVRLRNFWLRAQHGCTALSSTRRWHASLSFAFATKDR